MGKVWPALDIYVPGCDPVLLELVLAELDDFQPTAIEDDEASGRLRVFFAVDACRLDARRALASAFGQRVFVQAADVDDEDWAARSQAQLRAIRIGRLVVAPPWDLPASPAMTVIVEPSMGFGTGHHATTRLVLRMLQECPLEGRRVLDIGCGSGVLAIAALRLGARSATGIDLDEDALQNARENADLNGVGETLVLEAADFQVADHRADVVMANLTGALLERAAAELARAVLPGGVLIVSGFMTSEAERVTAALTHHLDLHSSLHEDEWMAAAFNQRSRHT